MANVSLYDPFSSRLNKLFNNFPAFPAMFEEKEGLGIKIDVSEDEKNFSVRADIPGVKKEDIRVDIDGNRVSISAEAKKSKEEKKENVVYSERYEGKVFRSFTLDSNVDEAKAEAKYADGVLELTLPKKGNGSAKRLAVQ
jgi:HSP20 family protein